MAKTKKANRHAGNDNQYSKNVLAKIKNATVLNLAAQYVTALIASGYGMKKYDLLSLNIIDMRPLMRPMTRKADMPDPNDMFKDRQLNVHYETKMPNLCEITPCFEKGVCQVNDDRYIYWEIRDINPKEQSITLRLMTYAEYSGIWCPEVNATYIMRFDTENHRLEFSINDHDVLLTSHMSGIFSHFDEQMVRVLHKQYPYINDEIGVLNLGWNDDQKKLWIEQVVKPSSRTTMAQCDAGTHNAAILSDIFIRCITVLNHYLQNNKPRPIPKNSSLADKCRQAPEIHIAPDAIQSDRIIRLIGTIPVHSREIPRATTSATLINYKTPTWTSRGHFRTYKSGKVVYVRESTHRRRCMRTSSENNTQQTIIKFKDAEDTAE